MYIYIIPYYKAHIYILYHIYFSIYIYIYDIKHDIHPFSSMYDIYIYTALSQYCVCVILTKFYKPHTQMKKIHRFFQFNPGCLMVKSVLFSLFDLFGIRYPIGSMYAIYANIWGVFMVNVTI